MREQGWGVVTIVVSSCERVAVCSGSIGTPSWWMDGLTW